MESLTKKLQGGKARKLGWVVEIKISWQQWLLIGEIVSKKNGLAELVVELDIGEANGCRKNDEANSCRKKRSS